MSAARFWSCPPALLAAGLLQALPAAAQPAVGDAVAAPPSASAAPAAAAPPAPRDQRDSAVTVDRRVIEDEQVRIEELRVRGQPVRLTVHSKVQGGSTYEINLGRGGRDPSQDSGKAGQSAWRLFRF